MLLSTMVSGIHAMDAIIVVMSAQDANHRVVEHLAAIELLNPNVPILIALTRMKSVTGRLIELLHADVVRFIRGTRAENSIIIPISEHAGWNVDVLREYICSIPIPMRDLTLPPEMSIIRSWNVNQMHSNIDDWVGGILGGALKHGIIKVLTFNLDST
eukprot:TRINITY_DN6709_c0_g1_i6.p2 TRINITY_DN6709_c0_g1~~TRINITY_DN6709_c0_g1_i6.p2  ORF type:complete len:158 (-),score=54.02 TRINITY_DN6709_c0_g1_i6:567-1040(-)